MRLSAGRAERQFVQPDFANERGARPRAAWRQNRLIVDGGQSQVGIESTVLDLTVSPPRILRPGMIHAESLAAVGGEIQNSKSVQSPETALRSPGLLAKHYSPKAKLMVLAWRDERGIALATFNFQLSAFDHSRHRAHQNSRRFRRGKGERDSARCGGVCAGALRGAAPVRCGGREVDSGRSPAGFAGMGRHRGPVAARGGLSSPALVVGQKETEFQAFQRKSRQRKITRELVDRHNFIDEIIPTVASALEAIAE